MSARRANHEAPPQTPADPAPRAVAIHVEIRSVAAEPVAQGDAEDVEPPRDTLDSADVTAALPAPAKTGEANDSATLDASEPEDSDTSELLGAVANVDAARPSRWCLFLCAGLCRAKS